MTKVSIPAFRVAVGAGSTAAAPVEVKLSPICKALVQLEIWCTTVPVMITSGWRMRSREGLIVPDVGSDESGMTAGASTDGWAPLPNSRAKIIFCDREIPGPPFDLTLQFYSAAAIEVGGILTVRDPQFGIHDLVMHFSRWMAKNEATNHGTSEYK